MASRNIERKLAAIVAVDIAGYSRLMRADEVGTLQALKAHRKALIDPMIAAHHGRIVKTTGDGMLVDFASVVDAVTCSVAIQRGMITRNADVPEDKRILFRVGINLGDIIVEEKDIYGDGVNVAARLQELAQPGGVCVSRTVRNHVRDKVPFDFEDLGEQTVKNITQPVRVYALGSDAIGKLPVSTLVDADASKRIGRSFLGRSPTVSALPRVHSVGRAAAFIVAIGVVAIAGWQISDRFGLFRLAISNLSVEATDPRNVAKDYDKEMEIAFWNAVKDSKSPIILSTYLDRFPTGTFAGLARVMVEQQKDVEGARTNLAAREEDARKAEEAKKAAEAMRSKADEAKRLEELNAAREEARRAQEEVRKKEADRLAALEVAEAARKSAQDAEAKLAAETEAKLAAETARASLAAREEELRRAEEAKRAAEADELRKVEEAKRLQELQVAREEARKAQEEVKKNEADRLAALKAAEDAPKEAQGAQAKPAVESDKTAALGTAAESNVPDVASTEPEALIRVVQTELKRVGCYSGSIDGQWGSRSREALADFAGFTKLSLPTDEPTSEALQAIAGEKSRVCPLQCSADEIEANGRCIARASPNKPSNPNKLGTVKRERKDFGGASQAKNSETSSTKTVESKARCHDECERNSYIGAYSIGAIDRILCYQHCN
jgi:class 3 adenylate cyclase